jgi:hypothetical protein
MNLERLRTTPLSALADRGAQEARKWLERSSLLPWGAHDAEPIAPEIERAAAALAEAPAGPRGARFFRGALEGVGESVARRFPGSLRETLRAAERLGRGRFDLLGYRDLDFGTPIDWRLEPVSGRRAPAVHWSLVRPLDAARVGDSKVVWELNRCQWWVTLARAWAMTGEPWLVERLAGLAQEWRSANPPGLGINWASSLEVSLRLVSWCWTAVLVRRSGALDAPAREALVLGVREHARHVARYLSRQHSPNTHLTGEALGLFYAGCALPELAEASRWRRLGARILVEQIGEQVLPDGVYFEQSTGYQRYTIDIYLQFLILAAHCGFPVPGVVRDGVTRMLDFMLALRQPDGAVPAIGDGDGGALLPLAERAASDLRGVFSTAAAWFRRADYAWAAGGLAPETLWLLGEEGAEAFQALAPRPPGERGTRLFPDGGYAVLRSGWERDAHQLVFDVGPFGCPLSGGHGHADLLSIQCSVFGEPVLVDPGTGVYADPTWRDHLRSSSAHSTVTIDGEEQARPAGPFRWETRPHARVLRWIPGSRLDVVEAVHDAYARLPHPVRHRRRVLFVEERFWIVVDDLEGAGEHRLDVRFQFAPIPVVRDGADGVRALTPGGRAMWVRAFAARPLALALHVGELDPPRGWISPDYGQRVPAPLLVATLRGPLPARVATLLFPMADATGAPPQVSALRSRSGPTGLSFAGGHVVRFGAE